MNLMKVCMAALISLVATSAGLAQAPRIDRVVNEKWKFARENPAGAESIHFDDSGWESIALPHTWNARDGQDGGNDYYRGTGWYRKRLRIQGPLRGKSIFLKFDGAATASKVFVNGREAGVHRGNFGAFCFDVTSLVHAGRGNIVAVRVNNARDSSITPLSGDFTIFGGIYRSVHLLILNNLSVSPLDYASPGVYVAQKEVTRKRARLQISAVIRNGSDLRRTAVVRTTIVDPSSGAKPGGAQGEIVLEPGATDTVAGELTLARPHLWEGRNDPHLYRVVVEVVERGRVTDRVEQMVGLRFFSVDPEKGFYLNGESYPLHGVNRHQDRLNKGWAIGLKEHQEDYALIAEMGCTTIRLAHYQHAQEFYDLCDRGGMVVWAELALVDAINPRRAFAENCRGQLTELIKQNFNHPSIVVWGLENELMPKGQEELYGSFVRDLHRLARQLDPSRLTTVASRGDYDATHPMNTVTDVIGYNLYMGWYEGKAEDFGARIDGLHRQMPFRPVAVSEYGAGAGISQHEVPPWHPEPRGPWHPEEWQSWLHEVTWKQMVVRPYLWGTFIWNMFDFASDSRAEGELAGRNDKGLVTYDRKVKKDAFYYYKANWNPAPMVYIASRRFTPRPAGRVEVTVYSNCPSVRLIVNGVDAGERKSPDRALRWPDVELKPGRNVVQATGISGSRHVEDTVTWLAITAGGGQAPAGQNQSP